MAIVVCSLVCLYTLETYIANNMDPDQTAPFRSSLIRAHSVCFHDKTTLECISIYAADVISSHFQIKTLSAGLGLMCQFMRFWNYMHMPKVPH